MNQPEIPRKSLDNQQFLQLRQQTDKIAAALEKRLREHLAVLRPLFTVRRLLGTYIKSSLTEEVPGSDKAFAELQEAYGAVCEKPFGLPRKLQAPLAAMPNQLETTRFTYSILLGGPEKKAAAITSPTRWILSYRSECPLSRLTAMLSGEIASQADEMRQAILSHLAVGLFLRHYPGLEQLLRDLRYEVETLPLPGAGGLPAVVLRAPLDTFLPPDEFILQITQLSGIPAFQEIIDADALDRMADPLKDALRP